MEKIEHSCQPWGRLVLVLLLPWVQQLLWISEDLSNLSHFVIYEAWCRLKCCDFVAVLQSVYVLLEITSEL